MRTELVWSQRAQDSTSRGRQELLGAFSLEEMNPAPGTRSPKPVLRKGTPMVADSIRARILVVAIVFAKLLFSVVPTHAQSAGEILQKARDIYAQLKSYSDAGVVLNQYGVSSEDKHSFSTLFIRTPRHVLLDFHKQGGDRYVIWADPDAFHT